MSRIHITQFYKVFENTKWMGVIVLSIVLGILYWRTLLPSMGTWGDPAKLQFLGKVLGTPHLSGTPLYLMLNHIFVTAVPKGSIAYKSNLLSAIFSLLALWFLYYTLLELDIKPTIAFVTALTFGLGYTMWSQSLMAEVYTLMTLFITAVVFFLVRWKRTRKNGYFLAACFLYALSFGNHLLIIGLLPAFIYITLATDREVIFKFYNIVAILFFVLIGASQYLYIPWRTNSQLTPFLETNTEQLLDFIASPVSSAASRFSIAEIITNRLPRFIYYIWREYYLLVLGGIIGVVIVKDKIIRRFILIGLLSTFVVAMMRYAREYEVYFLPFYVFFIILIGYGLDWLTNRLRLQKGLVLLAFIIPILLIGLNYSRVDHHNRTLWARITEKVLNTVKEDAVILAPNYDNATFFWYYLIGEGYESKNIFAMQVDYQNLDAIKDYLKGKESLYIHVQRKAVPPGLKVFVMEETARELEKIGLVIRNTNTKYIYEVHLQESSE